MNRSISTTSVVTDFPAWQIPQTQKARRVAGFRAQSYCSNIAVHNKNAFVKRELRSLCESEAA
jgi:hypothetical protein